MMRRDQAHSTRKAAARMARNRLDQNHTPNNDEMAYRDAQYAMTFTKGLKHDKKTLLAKNADEVAALRDAIDGGYVEPFNTIKRPPNQGTNKPIRKWEAPTAGFVHDLQGPDAQEVTMPPAPHLGSTELTYEMAEVYELALLRDIDLSDLAIGSQNQKVQDAIARLNAYGRPGIDFDSRPRTLDNNRKLTVQNLFRGSSPGVDFGPYVSQFLLMGNKTLSGLKPEDGYIMYGAQRIDQRVPVAKKTDWMMKEQDYLDVQNGLDVRNNAALFDLSKQPRFIQTPRDLATYVHDDALYQAYLNACLILLSQGAPFDPHFDRLSGMGTFRNSNVGGFALWGGPHILSLVTEVATRALKAVRFQKFNVHLRLRPEALAARVHMAYIGAFTNDPRFDELDRNLQTMLGEFSKKGNAKNQSLTDAIMNHTGNIQKTMLLPMAFQEGSPMHPSYGAGHAAVAGACVTILKAYFDTSAVLLERTNKVKFDRLKKGDNPVQFTVQPGNNTLNKGKPITPLTLEGELNKLAANISIGRNMAGVHYFSDYYDSLRMGEEIAIGMLEEQALTYPKDPFVMSLVTFDGNRRMIYRK